MSFEDEVLIDDGYNSEDQLEREVAAGPETSSSSSDAEEDASEGILLAQQPRRQLLHAEDTGL